jgi:molybdopterin-guanine dinucleotide biosynthesis protein A
MGGPIDGVTGLVLAGGNSTRFGNQNKLLAEYNGQPLVDCVITTLCEVTEQEPEIAVQNAEQRDSIRAGLSNPGNVVFASDDPAFSGPVAGIYGGTRLATTEWIFVCAGDMPRLSSTAIRWLVTRRENRTDSAVVPVGHPDQYEPLHALYRRTALERIRETLSDGVGVQSVVASLDSVQEIRTSNGPPVLEESLTNVNSKNEFRALDGGQSSKMYHP